MSTKPGTLPRWSTDLSNITTPSSGQMDTGWTVGQDGVSDYQNFLSYWAYKWCEYVNDGVFEDITVDNLTVTGAVTHTGITSVTLSSSTDNFDPLSTGSTENLHTILVTSQDYVIGGLVGGVNGREIEIVNVGSFNLWLENEKSATTAENRLTFTPNIVALGDEIIVLPGGSVRLIYTSITSRWRVVSLTGCMNYQRIIAPSGSAAIGQDSVHSSGHIALDKGADPAAIVYYPISLPPGFLMNSWGVYVKKLSDAGTELNADLVYRDGDTDTVVSTLDPDTNTVDAPGYTSLTGSVLGTTVPSTSRQYYIILTTTDDDTETDLALHSYVEGWGPL